MNSIRKLRLITKIVFLLVCIEAFVAAAPEWWPMRPLNYSMLVLGCFTLYVLKKRLSRVEVSMKG